MFVSCSRSDDPGGWIDGLVDVLREDHRRLATSELRVCLDTQRVSCCCSAESCPLGVTMTMVDRHVVLERIHEAAVEPHGSAGSVGEHSCGSMFGRTLRIAP